jgi:hypothetical protein
LFVAALQGVADTDTDAGAGLEPGAAACGVPAGSTPIIDTSKINKAFGGIEGGGVSA